MLLVHAMRPNDVCVCVCVTSAASGSLEHEVQVVG